MQSVPQHCSTLKQTWLIFLCSLIFNILCIFLYYWCMIVLLTVLGLGKMESGGIWVSSKIKTVCSLIWYFWKSFQCKSFIGAKFNAALGYKAAPYHWCIFRMFGSSKQDTRFILNTVHEGKKIRTNSKIAKKKWRFGFVLGQFMDCRRNHRIYCLSLPKKEVAYPFLALYF